MSGVIKQSFSVNLKILTAFHLYPPEKYTSAYKFQAHIMHLICTVPVPVLGVLYLLLTEDLDMARVHYNAFILPQSACFITKLLPFITNCDRIKKCIDYFDSPYFTVHRDKQMKIIDGCTKICLRNSRMFLILVAGGFTNWAINPFFLKGYVLPIDVWLPFDPRAGPVTYSCVYIFVTIGLSYDVIASAVIDPLIGGLACQATGQLQVLKDNLQNLSQYADEEISKINQIGYCEEATVRSKIIYGKIQQCIDHHNAILFFIKELEECFSSVVFSQLVGSLLAICFCCLQLSQVQSLNFDFFSAMADIVIILSQIYFYCYYGTVLFEESNTLSNAIFMGEWYEYDLKSQKALITFMERSKIPITVTAGKLFDLSLETFTMILRRSYSLFTVLKNK